jgi:AcrR family transcriptional regulator
MNKDAYHHGNLREALLREGFKILSEEGEEKLSLREIAKRCNVSSAAPYAHFKDKDEFLSAMQDFVMQELTNQLRVIKNKCAGEKSILIDLGMSYILFFLDNPNYYPVLFSQSDYAEAILWNEESHRNPAFTVLKDAAEPILAQVPISDLEKHNLLIAMWALVHGLAAIICVPGVAERFKEDPDAHLRLRKILSAFSAPSI